MEDAHAVGIMAAILLASQVLREHNNEIAQSFGFPPARSDIQQAVRDAVALLEEVRMPSK